MNSSAKQIQSSVAPNLIVGLSPSLTLRAFLKRLRWNNVKKCCTTAIYTHTGGLIRFYLVIWSVLCQFKWPLLFLHHRGRGRDTRLSIRSQDPNNSSDTETRCPCLDIVCVIICRTISLGIHSGFSLIDKLHMGALRATWHISS